MRTSETHSAWGAPRGLGANLGVRGAERPVLIDVIIFCPTCLAEGRNEERNQ